METRTNPALDTAAAHEAKAYTETLRRRGGDVVRALLTEGVLTRGDLRKWFFAPIRRASR